MTTPEDRALALFPLAFGETLSPYQIDLRDRISQAITEAEDAKLGEALALLQADYDDAGGDAQNAIHDCMAVLRSLKSEQGT